MLNPLPCRRGENSSKSELRRRLTAVREKSVEHSNAHISRLILRHPNTSQTRGREKKIYIPSTPLERGPLAQGNCGVGDFRRSTASPTALAELVECFACAAHIRLHLRCLQFAAFVILSECRCIRVRCRGADVCSPSPCSEPIAFEVRAVLGGGFFFQGRATQHHTGLVHARVRSRPRACRGAWF